MTRKTTFAPDEFYHIYNRGTEKRRIFIDKRDYERFISLLYLCNDEKLINSRFRSHSAKRNGGFDCARSAEIIDICAYCLMPNHFHIIVKEKSDNGISRFVQKLSTGYTMYFNTKNERSGALFQGKFKASHVNNDNYLSYLISYVHLNPVKLLEPKWKEVGIKNKSKASNFLHSYQYSSFIDYMGVKRTESAIINKNSLPKYFKTPKDFKDHVEQWLSFANETF